MEGNHQLDPLHWASILEYNKVLGLLGGWVVWIHKELQLYQLSLVRVSPIQIVHLLHIGNKRYRGKGDILEHRRMQSSERFRKLTHGYCSD
jgi:hypothetical protein